MSQIKIRVTYTLIAIAVATTIVVALSYTGKKTKGPIEDLFTGAGEMVQKVEQEVIINQRENKRSNKLQWLNAYKENPALLLHPTTILLGAFDNQNKDSYEASFNLEDSLKTTFPLIHIYTAWGSQPNQQFPKDQIKAILELGSLPVITWEPWLTDFDAEKIAGLRAEDKRDVGGLRDIANGKYDSYLKSWAGQAAQIKEPIFLRVGHEMNDPYRYPWGPQNNTAKDFVAAWQHIHRVFSNEGAKNVIWIWSPHPAYGFFDAFYPGDKFVDYVGVGILNYGTIANWSKWWSFGEIFGNHYSELAAFNKPIMITEFGCLNVGGKRELWFEEALHQLPQKYPLIKSILFFHFSDDNTTTQQTINWYFIHDKPTIKNIRSEIKSWDVK